MTSGGQTTRRSPEQTGEAQKPGSSGHRSADGGSRRQDGDGGAEFRGDRIAREGEVGQRDAEGVRRWRDGEGRTDRNSRGQARGGRKYFGGGWVQTGVRGWMIGIRLRIMCEQLGTSFDLMP